MARSTELETILDRGTSAEVVVRVDADTPVEVAGRVLAAVGFTTPPTA